MSFRCPMRRRDFIKTAAAGALGAAAGLNLGCPARSQEEEGAATVEARRLVGDEPATVVIGHHEEATVDGQVQLAAVEQMVDSVVTGLAGVDDPVKAWATFFSSDEKVGVKINGLGGPFISTARQLTQVVVARLTGMGVKPENIFIWDQNPNFVKNCGLEVDSREWGTNITTMEYGWTDAAVKQGSFEGHVTTLVTDVVDAYVSLPIMKDHAIAGVTMALKQHYGTHKNPWDHHGNNCDPFIADLNTIPSIRDKQRLIICDATRAVCNDGPGFNANFLFHPNMLLAATDPVAHDTIGAQMIEEERKAKGLSTLEESGRPYVHIASSAERGLGTNDPGKIEVARLEVG